MPSNEYQVKSGDTLGAIARRYQVKEDVLARLNGISDVNRIFVGQVLKIPEAPPLQQQAVAQPETYRVAAGDTLASIAQRFQLPGEALAQANSRDTSERVMIGQVLVLPPVTPPKPRASTAATTTTTTTTPPKQTAQAGTVKDEDNLKLGVNEQYREALLAASRRTGLPPQCLAAIIEAEAAKEKKTKCWKADSKATTSSAAGLSQFLAGTWVGEACREGTSLHDTARSKELIEEVLDKKGRRKGWKVKSDTAKATLLELRLKPEVSIMAAAELALSSLASIRKAFKVPASVTRSDLARLAYLYHHEGASGGERILRKKDSHSKADLERQTGSKAAQYLKANGEDATLAYRAWLGDYINEKINPLQFAADPKQFPAPRPLKDIIADLSAGTTAAPVKATATATVQASPTGGKGPDLKQLARNVHDAMAEGDFLGMGTNEAKVYSNLAWLNHDATLIKQFKTVYKSLYGVEVETDLRADFSNNWFSGNELNLALSYLKPGEPQKAPAKAPAKPQDKTQAPTPSLKVTPDLQALLKELHVSIESFVTQENAYFAQLTRLLAFHGTVKAASALTRDTFREAVKSFQKSKALTVTEGIPDEKTLFALQADWAEARKLKLPKVVADQVKGVDGYNNFTVREDLVDDYNAFRQEVLAAGGVVTSAGSLRVLTAEVTAGRSSVSMHYSGLALDLATYSGMQDPKKDPYIITQDGKKWRIWCRSASASEKKLEAVVHSKGKTSSESVTVKAFDFTSVAEKHGFARIGPRSSFPGDYMSAEWWHLQYERALNPYISQFGAELLSLEKYDEAALKAHQGIWNNRTRVFKRGANGWF